MKSVPGVSSTTGSTGEMGNSRSRTYSKRSCSRLAGVLIFAVLLSGKKVGIPCANVRRRDFDTQILSSETDRIEQ